MGNLEEDMRQLVPQVLGKKDARRDYSGYGDAGSFLRPLHILLYPPLGCQIRLKSGSTALTTKVCCYRIREYFKERRWIGIIILESLLNSYRRQGVDYLNFGIASFDLIYKLRNTMQSLLIDGIAAGLAPGELKIFELKDIAYVSKGAGIHPRI